MQPKDMRQPVEWHVPTAARSTLPTDAQEALGEHSQGAKKPYDPEQPHLGRKRTRGGLLIADPEAPNHRPEPRNKPHQEVQWNIGSWVNDNRSLQPSEDWGDTSFMSMNDSDDDGDDGDPKSIEQDAPGAPSVRISMTETTETVNWKKLEDEWYTDIITYCKTGSTPKD
jgi:hypothetical protein